VCSVSLHAQTCNRCKNGIKAEGDGCMSPGEIAGVVVGVWVAMCLCVYVWKIRKDARELRERGGL
jgi:hypothetical protein